VVIGGVVVGGGPWTAVLRLAPVVKKRRGVGARRGKKKGDGQGNGSEGNIKMKKIGVGYHLLRFKYGNYFTLNHHI